MKIWSRILSQMFLLSTALLLTGTTFVLGAVPLYGFRRSAGRLGFFATLLVVGAVLWFFGPKALLLAFLTQAILVEVFVECDESPRLVSTTGLVAVAVTGLTLAGAFALWIGKMGSVWLRALQDQVEAWLKPVLEANPNLPLTAVEVVRQIPSAALVLLSFSVFFMLLFERRILMFAGIQAPNRPGLRSFSAPAWMVWILIGSLLATFGQFGNEVVRTVGVNFLNVMLVAYFFQGLAVLSSYLQRWKVTPVWQALILGLACVQLFLAVSLVGVIDYWAGFRERMKRSKSPELKQETQE